jgi:DNA-binding NarL/FixJ family response regulator
MEGVDYMARKKGVNLFIVDHDTKMVNQIEEYCQDNFEMRIAVRKKKLTKNGFNTKKIEMLETDIFIFYASLSDGSAIELVEQLKLNRSLMDKKIIFLVDKQTMNYVEMAYAKGVDVVLQKPFSINRLFAAIEQLRES